MLPISVFEKRFEQTFETGSSDLTVLEIFSVKEVERGKRFPY